MNAEGATNSDPSFFQTYGGELWQTTKDAFTGTPGQVAGDLLQQGGTIVKQGATAAAGATVGQWFGVSSGNALLIIVGVILGLGALLISQRPGTIIKTVGKVAAA